MPNTMSPAVAGSGTAPTVLPSSVTAPFSAKTPPCTVAPVVRVLLWLAMMMPRKSVPMPSVADEPT